MPSEAVIPDERAEESSFWLLAGDCHVRTTGAAERERRGHVLVLVKPDDTVLVHDIDGYQPIAWVTRAETVSFDHEEGVVTAVDGDTWLRIDVKHAMTNRRLPGSRAGRPVGTCPDCAAPLVHAAGGVHCMGCEGRYGLPTGASLTDGVCECGLPQMRVVYGDTFELCIDRECEPLEAALADRFDDTWDCPEADCDGSLRIIRRGGLMAGCDAYPDCDVAFNFPTGRLAQTCGCGLPRFAVNEGTRCLDARCEVE